MQMDRSKNFIFWPFPLLLAVLIFLAACGGGGGGGDSTTPPPTNPPTQADVNFRQTVLKHFQNEFVTLQNNGSTSRTIGTVAQSDPLAAPFSIADDECSGATLAATESCTITVRFSPNTQDTFTDTFDITSDSGQPMMVVNLTGPSVALNASISQVDKSACPTIRMFVTVTDSDDEPATGLAQDDFLVSENGDPQDIVSFTDTVSSPISTVLAMDSSGSIAPDLADVEAAAKSFIAQLTLDNGTDEAAIIKFASTAETKQAFTDDSALLNQAIEAVYSGNIRETHLYDTVWEAVALAADTANNDRRAVVVISDGYDEGSVNHDLAGVIEYANENGVPIFTIGLGDIYITPMQLMADGSGGQYFVAPTAGDLETVYQRIAQILTNQYVIEYVSSTSGGGAIALDIEVDGNGLIGEDTKSLTGCP